MYTFLIPILSNSIFEKCQHHNFTCVDNT
uniref:Uncharacterized protein n=1 Tax=Anguilla anguilla TaxID=7936 RepID=A0A0E9UHW7_ANGAN